VPGWLRNIFKKPTAASASRENPVLLATVERSSKIYKKTPLGTLIDAAMKDLLARQLFLDTNQICNSIDPVVTCREKLAAAMMRYASFQVLLIPPAPEPDASGLRELPGITGDLGAHLIEIAERNFDLRSELIGLSGKRDPDTILKELQRSFWQAYWFLETFNAARLHLGDSADDSDWYSGFRFAACASYEGRYRGEANLPSAFDDDVASIAPNAYAIFTDIVLAGAEDPVQEWRDYHAGIALPMPDFR
jgi:hypothetical protein